jgi:hypothetical protein
MAYCQPTKVPPAPIICLRASDRPARTDAEMDRDVVRRGTDPEGPYLMVESSDAFPLWFGQPNDLVWKYRYEVTETEWFGWWIFKVPLRRRLLLFRPMDTREPVVPPP